MARAEEEDYMGDLSLFLPPDQLLPSSSSSSSSSSASKKKDVPAPGSKRPKLVPWQEQRRIDRETKQKREDDLTVAATKTQIPQSNVGFRMLKMMGYNPGSALGREGTGLAEPLGLEIRRSRAGIGRESEVERREGKRREMVDRRRRVEEGKRRREADLMMEFGVRQKMQWRSKSVEWDYRKAEAALAQLENREVVVEKKEEEEEEEDEEEEKEEEEEEHIKEEDLQGILMKLREEHRYCLYCGCQYESAESLEANCPGLTEEDH